MGVRTRPENWATFHSFSDGNTEAGTHPAHGHFPEASSPPIHHKPPNRRSPREQILESDHLQRGFGLTNVALMLQKEQQKPRGKCSERLDPLPYLWMI